MLGRRFWIVAMMLASLMASFVGGVVFWRWFEVRGTSYTIGNARPVTNARASNPLADEPLITPQLLRAALSTACENSDSRNFYGPGVYNIPRSLWDEAIRPASVLPDKPQKSAEELRNEKEFQKEVEAHQKELESICRDRDRIRDTEIMLPSQWLCEEAQIPDEPSAENEQKMKDWQNFAGRHHLSEDKFNELYVAFQLAMGATSEGGLRQDGQCLLIKHASGRSSIPNGLTLHDIEDDEARERLCAARAISADGQDKGQLQWLLLGFTVNNNISTQRAREIMEQAIRDAKAKDPDVTWARFCAATPEHNDDWRRLEFSVFERAR